MCFKAGVVISRMQFWTIHDIEQMEIYLQGKKVEGKNAWKEAEKRNVQKDKIICLDSEEWLKSFELNWLYAKKMEGTTYIIIKSTTYNL